MQEEWLKWAVPPLERPFVIGQMGETEVPAPVKHGRKPSEPSLSSTGLMYRVAWQVERKLA